jgi:flagellar basal-body rod protein FlgB
MSTLDTPNVQSLSRYLDLVAFRQGLISQNVANVDTPGYRTKDVNFRRELRRAMGDETESPAVQEVPGLLQRPDGNNVSLDREGLLMAETQLQFRTAVQLLRTEFRRIQSAIQEGR